MIDETNSLKTDKQQIPHMSSCQCQTAEAFKQNKIKLVDHPLATK